MTKHVIELNGLKYDAQTGKPLAHSASPAKASKPAKATVKHLDGFTRRPGAALKPVSPAAAKPSTAAHGRQQRSQTLMRTSVKKPASSKIHAKTAAPAHAAPVKHAPPGTIEAIKPGRAIRATHIAQSKFISKFGRGTPVLKTEVVPVAPEPSLMNHAAKPLVPAPAAKKTVSAKTKADPFRSAVEQAVSHTQPKAKKPRVHHRIAKKLHVSPRLVSFAGVVLLALGVGGFLAYQNLPGIAMRVASTRAGLKAALPTYQPAGFSMAGPIEYEPGEVKLSYKSNSDERSFQVTQKNSSWNSETLLENYVSPSKQPYQTFQANGRTIYIYDGNKATWVDGGVWYTIDGKSNLNSDQLLRIANGL